jgi:hypothetical protein
LELRGDVVTVDPDDLRQFHPRIHALQREYPYTWSGQTHADASQWADELREAATAGRKNLILDTTLSNGEWTAEMINDLKAKGYEVEVRAVVAHKLESEHGVDERFSQKLDEDGFARYVPEEVRTHVYDKIPASLDTVHERTGVPIRLYSREGAELYDSRTTSQTPGAALAEAREARMRDPAIVRQVREGWVEQQAWHRELPKTLPENPRIDQPTAERLLAERTNAKVVENVTRYADDATRSAETQGIAAARASTGPVLARGAVAVGVVVAAADAYGTAKAVERDLNHQNPTAADAKLIDFSARTGVGVAGASAGFAVGSAIGTPVIGGVIGGGLGYVGGDAYAQWRHREAIYTQDDAQGRTWRLDPDKPEQGWQRTTSERAPGPMNRVESVTVQADAALTNQLNAKATTTSLEMALGDLSPGANPHRLSRSPGDATSIPDTPWNRDPRTGDWTRAINRVEDNGTDLGRTVHVRTETASPERAAQLEAQSQRIIEANAAMSAPVMAARYMDAHRANGWEADGPPSMAISSARSRTDELMASDGHRYQRSERGDWVNDGVVLDTAANPLIHRELELTRQAAIKQAREIDPPSQAQGRDATLATEAPLSKAVGAPGPKAEPLSAIPATHPDYPMYAALRERLPAELSNEKVAEAATAIRMAGMKRPEQLDMAKVRDDKIFLQDRDAFSWAIVRTDTPAPSIETSLERSDARRQEIQQAIEQMQARDQAMQESQGMSMRIGARTMGGPSGEGAAAGGGE